jgi:hypothetical protein
VKYKGTPFILPHWPVPASGDEKIKQIRNNAMKVILQPSIRGLSGKMGDWVYRYSKSKKKTYIGEMPVRSGEQTEGQLAQQERFTDGSRYACEAMQNPALAEFYTAAAEELGITPQNAAMADFLSVPSFKPLDLSGYKGRAGDLIVVRAVAKFGLASLEVTIDRQDGSDIEKGQAVEIATNKWIYAATQAVPLGTDIFIDVVGTDHTGQQVKMSENPTVGVEE